jgi:hypothetical protein
MQRFNVPQDHSSGSQRLQIEANALSDRPTAAPGRCRVMESLDADYGQVARSPIRQWPIPSNNGLRRLVGETEGKEMSFDGGHPLLLRPTPKALSQQSI